MDPRFAYVVMVESKYQSQGRSHKGAFGFWQFMPASARAHGLVVSRKKDERRDLFKSTKAAASHLKTSYKRFKNWPLSLAAYNCGDGCVKKAIRRSGGHFDFWKVKRYLPSETRAYVPRVLAASLLGESLKEAQMKIFAHYLKKLRAYLVRKSKQKEPSFSSYHLSFKKEDLVYRRNSLPYSKIPVHIRIPSSLYYREDRV